MKVQINKELAVCNRGNLYRMKQLMERATRGERLTIGFIGGSITQGARASEIEKCYAYHVYQWWLRSFPQSDFVWLNAGIGATTSHYAAGRIREDLLSSKPDFVIVEFSVNDESNEHFLETYEGLVRQILKSDWQPAVMLVHNVFYDTGANAQVQHGKIGRYYDLPSVSMQSSIYPEIVSGRLENRQITEDDLHPNDEGHALVASMITYYLEKIKINLKQIADSKPVMPVPLTKNAYEKCSRYHNRNCEPICEGFCIDQTPQINLADCFKNGWTAKTQGARIIFEQSCTGVAVVYRKSVKKPSPIARVIIDGDLEQSVLLDSNFYETWGDKLEVEMIADHMEKGMHRIEIEICGVDPDNMVPFYLGGLVLTE